MNKSAEWKKAVAAGLAALLVLASLCAAGLADQAVTPGLVEGVTWDTTPEEILEAEGVSGMEDLIDAAYSDEGTSVTLVHSAEGDEPTRQFSYMYKAGLLVAYGCTIASFYQAEGTDMTQYYDIYLDRLSQVYGDPAEQDQERIDALYAAFIAEEQQAYVMAFAGWDLGDDTVLFLVNMMDTTIMYMFISESRIAEATE